MWTLRRFTKREVRARICSWCRSRPARALMRDCCVHRELLRSMGGPCHEPTKHRTTAGRGEPDSHRRLVFARSQRRWKAFYEMSKVWYKDANHVIITTLLLLFTFNPTQFQKMHRVFLSVCVKITWELSLCQSTVCYVMTKWINILVPCLCCFSVFTETAESLQLRRQGSLWEDGKTSLGKHKATSISRLIKAEPPTTSRDDEHHPPGRRQLKETSSVRFTVKCLLYHILLPMCDDGGSLNFPLRS